MRIEGIARIDQSTAFPALRDFSHGSEHQGGTARRGGSADFGETSAHDSQQPLIEFRDTKGDGLGLNRRPEGQRAGYAVGENCLDLGTNNAGRRSHYLPHTQIWVYSPF